MSIYISEGYEKSELTIQRLEDSFDFFADYVPQAFTGHLTTFKKKKARYIISGYIEPNEHGQVNRNNDSLIRRDLLFLDYDNVSVTETELIDLIKEKLSDFNFVLYPTIRNGIEGVRYRLVVQPDRPLIEHEYKYVLKQVSDEVGIPIDTASFTWSQPQGLPVHRANIKDYEIIVNRGQKWKTPDRDDIPLPEKKKYECTATSEAGDPVPYDEAIQMLQNYVSNDDNNLYDYTNSLSAILVMAKAVMLGEITIDTAIEGCRIIAMGNVDWIEGNINKLTRTIDKGVLPRTPYSFRRKFYELFVRQSADCESLDELKKRLYEKGVELRAWIEAETEKEGIRLSPRQVTDIMLDVCTTVLINEDDPELSPLAIYDPDEGIYKKGDRFLYSLILKVDDTLSEHGCREVKHFLTNDDKTIEVRKTVDENLIICNNGVYDKSTKTLLPFSKEWVFVNKIATDYKTNAVEPVFNGWKFTEWIKELAEGDDNKEKLFYQMFYSAINANYISEVAFFFYSKEGRTGKGTMQELLRNLVGNENTSNLRIKEFESDFKLSTLYGKSLVLGDDNNPKDFNETSANFKSVITGEGVLLNGKYEKPFNTKLTPLVIQSMNGIPRFADTSDGLTRRLRIIEFKTAYKGTTNNRKVKDVYIKDKALHEFILKKVIDMDVYDIVNTDESQSLIEDLVLDNDPVMSFYDEVVQHLTSTRLPTKFLFSYFVKWSELENNPTKMKQRNFTKQMRYILESKGWVYEPKNLAPTTQHFTEEDGHKYNRLFHQWETNNYNDFINDIDKCQGLFDKLEKPNEQAS